MKCKVKAGELRDALQLALITVDRRQGSELGYIYIGARKNKGASQRILLHSTDGVVKLLARVNCEVEEAGELIVDPMRLASIIERQADEAVVTFSSEAGKGDRVTARCGGMRCVLSSKLAMKAAYEQAMSGFPYNAPDLFKIEAASLKSLLDRTSPFIFKKDGSEFFKNVLIRAVAGGYTALATNREVLARAAVVDANSPFKPGEPATELELPGRALAGLAKMLSRSKKETIRVIVTKTDGDVSNAVFFRTDDVFFGTALSAAKLPAMDAIFKNQTMDSSIEVAREPFLDSVSRSNPFCVDSTSGRLVQVELTGASLKLTASDQGGEFEEEIVASGEASGKHKGTFRAAYLSDVLRNSVEDNVTFKLGTALPHKMTTALMVLGADNGASYVVAGLQG